MTEDRDRNRHRNQTLSRRLFMREAAIGGTAAVAASGTAAAQEEGGGNESGAGGGNESGGNESNGNESNGNESNGNESGEGGGGEGNVEPDWPSFVQEANNFDGTDDQRGEDEVTVDVGAGDGLAFGPAGIWIDPGTTVVWEWTGEGGSHDVHGQDGEEYQSETTGEAGFTFEHTFEEEDQINTYQCDPHSAQGMHGGVAVGDGVPTREVQEDGGDEAAGVQLPDSARVVGVALTVALGSTLGLTYVFMKYGGDYEGDRVQ